MHEISVLHKAIELAEQTAKDNNIDLDEYILGILLANVPVRIVKKGAKLPGDGNNYRVISEDQYQKEKENSQDSRWSALDDLDL